MILTECFLVECKGRFLNLLKPNKRKRCWISLWRITHHSFYFTDSCLQHFLFISVITLKTTLSNNRNYFMYVMFFQRKTQTFIWNVLTSNCSSPSVYRGRRIADLVRWQLAGRSLPGLRHRGTVAGRHGPDVTRRKGSDHNSATGYQDKDLKKKIIRSEGGECMKIKACQEREKTEKKREKTVNKSQQRSGVSYLVHSSKQASYSWRSPRGPGVSVTSGKGRH